MKKTAEEMAFALYPNDDNDEVRRGKRNSFIKGYEYATQTNAEAFKRITDLANGMLDVVKDAPEDECTYCDDEGLYECDLNDNGHDVVVECGCGKSDRLSK